jgi:hypothetical protein
MRRVVNGEVDESSQVESTLFLDLAVQNIGNAVQIWNLSPSLNAFVQMVRISSLDLYFRERSFHRSGSRLTPKFRMWSLVLVCFGADCLLSVATSENGWTDDFLCKEWFTKSFIPQASTRNTSGKHILLIYDGHGSHDTLDLIELACKHNIILFCLPPHTTHKLQPLDVGVFGPFSRAWTDHCDEIIDNTGEEMPREDFIKEYMAVQHATFKAPTIQAAWRKSGCWPINRTIFNDDDFAPSVSTSTSASHVPASFPVILHDFHDTLQDSVVHSGSDADENDDATSNSNSDSDDNTPPHPPLDNTPPPRPHHPEAPPHSKQAPQPAQAPTMSVPVLPLVLQTVGTPSLNTWAMHSGRGPSLRHRVICLENNNAILQSHVSTLEAHCN